MMKKIALTLLVISALCMSLYATGRPVQPIERELIEAGHEMRRSGIVQFNFKDMDVEKFLLFMSELLQENFIIQPGLNQKVTIISSHPVTIEEARRMMITALDVVGITVQKTDESLVVREKSSPSWAQLPANPVPQSRKPARSPVASKDIAVYDDVPLEVIERFISRPLEESLRVRARYDTQKGGLEVQWIQNQSLLRRLGVRRGDVIKSVNGTELVTLNDIDVIIQSIISRKSFDITLLRGKETVSLKHSIRRASPDIEASPDIVPVPEPVKPEA